MLLRSVSEYSLLRRRRHIHYTGDEVSIQLPMTERDPPAVLDEPAAPPPSSGGMATLGQIGEYRPDDESFSVYVERFELFLSANVVQSARKVPLFLTVLVDILVVLDAFCSDAVVLSVLITFIHTLGGPTYGLLHNLVSSACQS